MVADNEPPPIITLTTDFGVGSRYVAAMKGVILSINPHATIVDISHSVPPQNIRAGAIVLAESALWFPPNTIHVAVIDPASAAVGALSTHASARSSSSRRTTAC